MTAATLTLTDFLLARIAEDEEAARDTAAAGWRLGTWRDEHTVLAEDGEIWIARCGHTSEAFRDGLHIARHDPSRVLAECEAKRRIVATSHIGDREYGMWDEMARALAAVYADHEDYHEEWRP